MQCHLLCCTESADSVGWLGACLHHQRRTERTAYQADAEIPLRCCSQRKRGRDPSAYGCGAFQNPPEVVAEAMKQVVDEFKHYFVTIEFAVYCSPRDEQNYLTFKRVLG